MKCVLVILSLTATVWCLPAEVYENEFTKFKEQFGKIYANKTEEAQRFKLFSENLDKILEHNQKFEAGKSSVKLGVNRFADMTYQEQLKFMEHPLLGLTLEQYKEEFAAFKEKFHKNYASEESEIYRFAIFVDNLDRIIHHNELYEQGIETFKQGVTNFTDMTQTEFLEWIEEQAGGKKTPYAPKNYLFEFQKFKANFKKSYANKKEEAFRFGIFSKNLDEIEIHNQRYDQGLEPYRKSITEFTDMTKQEFLQFLEEHSGGGVPWAPSTEAPTNVEK